MTDDPIAMANVERATRELTRDVVRVEFHRALIAEMLMDTEPRTLRLVELGKPDDRGFYVPTWVSESMDPPMPEPWIFDGYRRIYDNGKALPIWQARAVNLTDVEIEKGTGRQKASFQAGQGRSMVEARDALLEAIRAL